MNLEEPEMIKVSGSFEAALHGMILALTEEKSKSYNPFVIKLLGDWDRTRGTTDWFTSTS